MSHLESPSPRATSRKLFKLPSIRQRLLPAHLSLSGCNVIEWLDVRWRRFRPKSGYSVTVNDRMHPGVPSSAAKVAAQIIQAGGSAAPDEHAVEDERGNAAMITHAREPFGRLDVLVCNAGIIDFANILDLESGHFNELMAVNFWASVDPVIAARRRCTGKDTGVWS